MLREQLDAVTGERISALEGIGEVQVEVRKTSELPLRAESGNEPEQTPNDRESPVPERGRDTEMELGL